MFCIAGLVRAADSPPASPYAAWAPWIGGVWSAALPPENGTPRHSERTYAWIGDGQGVSLDGWDYVGDVKKVHVTATITWSAEDSRFHLKGTSSNGLVVENVTHQEGQALVSDITMTTKKGVILKARGRLTLTGQDQGTYQLYYPADADWVLAQDLKLERHGT
jgi:hypothetical protein